MSVMSCISGLQSMSLGAGGTPQSGQARAAELALGRATFLLTHDVYLPLTPAIAAAVYEAIHEQEKCVYFGE